MVIGPLTLAFLFWLVFLGALIFFLAGSGTV